MEDRRKYPTWQWVTGILVSLLLLSLTTLSAIAAYTYKDTQSKIDSKADRDDVETIKQDIRDLRNMMESHIIETGAGRIYGRRK